MADVLLVDDDGSVLLTLTIALRRHGHHVIAAHDGACALQQLRQHHFDFLVSDVRMPGMSGLELAARALRGESAPRVILTSAYSNISTPPNTLFLQKPVDAEQLHQLLSQHPPRSSGSAPAVPALRRPLLHPGGNAFQTV